MLTKPKQMMICTILLLCSSVIILDGQKATIREYKKVFTTYPYSDPDPVPLATSLYPYFRYEGFTSKPVQQAWKVVELENDYIKVIILPEIGGKVWTAIEKSTGKPFIYNNQVIKFRDIAMRGPYTSGGLELNYGIIGHTPNCATPVDYLVVENSDGSVSCILGVLDLLTKSNWRLEVRLPAGKAFFMTKSFWYNSTPISQPYYHWLNGGYKASGNLEFIFPGTWHIGHDGEYAAWPVDETNGRKISFYESNNFGGYKSYHVFGKYSDFFGAYWHDDGFGIARYGTHDDKAGKKIWIWGLSGQGMIWENLLTDSDGQYVEMQSGRLFNQNSQGSTFTPFKHLGFAPYGTDTWTEYFYPVLKTRGFVAANDFGALNIKTENGFLKLYISPVQPVDEILEVKEGGNTVYRKKVKLNPLKTFSDSVRFNGDDRNLAVSLGTNLLNYSTDPGYNVLSRPVEAPRDFDWNSSYGLYIQGKEAMDQKMYPLAETKLEASLEKDPCFLPSLVKLAELNYRNMMYPRALDLITKALSIDTHDGAANYYYGLINLANGRITDAKDGFDIASISAEYRSAAYTGLSRIYFSEGNYDRAFAYAIKATDFNRFNIDALQLRAAISRCRGNHEKAREILDTILSFDPLNHFARFEKYLLDDTGDAKKNFLDLIRNELPHETLMELAVWYYNSGCRDEAGKMISLLPAIPEKEYWRAFLTGTKADLDGINPDFSFPFRSETGMVIGQLLKNQDDWLLKYHLALIYRDRNRRDESVKLLMSCGDTPGYAPFYAARAAGMKGTDSHQCEADLKKALALDNQWRYHVLLAGYYIDRQQYDKALAVTGPYYRLHPDNFITGSLHARTLLLNRKYRDADAVLRKLVILPHEGATSGREMYREAKLMQALDAMEKKKTGEAIRFISEAGLWPENLGVGKPYDQDIDTRLEDWLAYLCLQRQKKTDEAGKMLHKITDFKPSVENGVRNFIPANTLISAWALERLGSKTDARNFIGEQKKKFPGYSAIDWSMAVFEQERSFSMPENSRDANVRIIERLVDSGL